MKFLLAAAASVALGVGMPDISPPTVLDIIPHYMESGFVPYRTAAIDTIVLHSSYNSSGGDVYSVERLIAVYRQYGVSAHYLIDRQGLVYRLVPDEFTSYHAGPSKMPDGRMGVNAFSIGIELMNTETDTYTSAQYESLLKLIALEKQKNSGIRYIVGHGQIAPNRRSDPWNFDWSRVTTS